VPWIAQRDRPRRARLIRQQPGERGIDRPGGGQAADASVAEPGRHESLQGQVIVGAIHDLRREVGKTIRCPYHAWTYSLDGQLVAAPNWRALDGIDRGRYRLHQVHVATWEGLIWVSLARQPVPLEDYLRPQIEDRLGDYGKFQRYRLGELAVGARAEYDVAANWKLIYENFQECYHCHNIHPELVSTIPQFKSPAMGAAGYDPGGYPIAAPRPSFSLTGQTVLPRLPGLLPADDRLFYGMVVRPNCFLSLVSDHVIAHRFEPVAPDRTLVVCEWLFPAQTLEAGHDVADAVALFSKVNEQDFAAAQWCQPNMSSRAYARGGVLVPSEAPVISRYYQWYAGLMGDACRSTTG
jgi:Rieske 2Fe-2S family protein